MFKCDEYEEHHEVRGEGAAGEKEFKRGMRKLSAKESAREKGNAGRRPLSFYALHAYLSFQWRELGRVALTASTARYKERDCGSKIYNVEKFVT